MIPIQKKRQTKSDILYNSQNGTNGVITLSNNISNYTMLEIFYGNKSKVGANSVRILTSLNGFDTYILAAVTEGVQLFINTSRYAMSGNKITPSICVQTVLTKESTSVTSITNQIYIYKVIGYK